MNTFYCSILPLLTNCYLLFMLHVATGYPNTCRGGASYKRKMAVLIQDPS